MYLGKLDDKSDSLESLTVEEASCHIMSTIKLPFAEAPVVRCPANSHLSELGSRPSEPPCSQMAAAPAAGYTETPGETLSQSSPATELPDS